jgi:glycosyltransferase involved in cell wall biosynthesis
VRIAFLTRSLNYGGAERQLVALAKGLEERGHFVTVAVFYAGGPLEKELRDAMIDVRVLDKRGRWDAVDFLWRLIKFLRLQKPDVVHSYLCVPNILAAILSLLFPRVRIAWGVRASDVELDKYDWLARLTYRAECLLSRVADLIIVNSYAGLDYAAAHGFPKNKMVVVHNGIDTDRFNPDHEMRRRVRSEWGVGDDETLIGMVGRLDPMKDHVNFLLAAALLAKGRDGLRFVCVGIGPDDYQKKLIELSEELRLTGAVIWAGARADMPAVYNAMDVVVSSSRSEGFPNVIGEAMSCGVSCVVTDVGDSARIVGDVGEVAPSKDPEALKVAIERAVSKISRDGRAQARKRQRIIERFSTAELVSKTEALLLRLN